MTKKIINKVLKERDYCMVPKSWYMSEDKTGILFKAYSKNCGQVYQFWIDTNLEYASCQTLSDVCIHKARIISHWFFD